MPETAELARTPILDEMLKRRPDWVEGVPFRMIDGQSWHLPRVAVGYQIKLRDPAEPPRIVRLLAATESNRRFGARFRDHQTAVAAAIDSGDDAAMMSAIAEAFADLVRRNYTMSDAEIETLLIFRPDDPEDVKLWRSIVDHVLADALPADPKPPAEEGGSDVAGDPGQAA